MPLRPLFLLPLVFLILVGATFAGNAVAPPHLQKIVALDGTTHLLPAPAAKATVIVFLATECPIANAYTARLQRLAAEWTPRGARFLAIYPNRSETDAAVRRHAAERGLSFTVAREQGGITKLLGARVTPEAVVLDPAGEICYRGRIDDNKNSEKVTRQDLREAIAAVLEGRPVAHSLTAAFGCEILRDLPLAAAANAADTPTYAHDVAPILSRNCVSCHRPGEVAPFALQTYDQAVIWADRVAQFTTNRQMPPWKADSHGEFHDERRLSVADIKTLADWAYAGTPPGNLAELPAPSQSNESLAAGRLNRWPLGEPDAVFTLPEPYTLTADGRDVYRCFVLPTNFGQKRWVAAVAFQPGNPRIVHHASAFVDTTGAARRHDQAEDGPGYTNPTPGGLPAIPAQGVLGGWQPGHTPRRLPDGVGVRLPQGADIVLEVHYHKSGKPETDQTKIGIYFARGPVHRALHLAEVGTDQIRIPAGDPNFLVATTTYIPEDITLLAITPHLHQLGRRMKVTARFPDGRERLLVNVPAWDFNWQLSYRYKQPVRLPEGTRIDLVSRYDNSAGNPNNPHQPPRTVRYGENSDDEMCVAFLAYTKDAEYLP